MVAITGRRRRSTPLHALQNMLLGGMFLFSVGIIIMYSHLMKIEPSYTMQQQYDDVGNMFGRGSLNNYNNGNKKKRLPPDQDPRLQKNNNHHNPGRAWGSEKGQIECDKDVYRLISYWKVCICFSCELVVRYEARNTNISYFYISLQLSAGMTQGVMQIGHLYLPSWKSHLHLLKDHKRLDIYHLSLIW